MQGVVSAMRKVNKGDEREGVCGRRSGRTESEGGLLGNTHGFPEGRPQALGSPERQRGLWVILLFYRKLSSVLNEHLPDAECCAKR